MRELLLEGTWNVWIGIDCKVDGVREIRFRILKHVDIYEVSKEKRMEEIFQIGIFSSE